MVRLVFRHYAHVWRTICTSMPLASIRVSPVFALPRHSSPSFASHPNKHAQTQVSPNWSVDCRCKIPAKVNPAKLVSFLSKVGRSEGLESKCKPKSDLILQGFNVVPLNSHPDHNRPSKQNVVFETQSCGWDLWDSSQTIRHISKLQTGRWR